MSEALKDALALSENILSDIELGLIPLTAIALKASRLARITGDFEGQQLFLYEVGGYPNSPSGVPKDVWKLLKKAGRVYQQKIGDEPATEHGQIDSIEQIESAVEAAKENLPAARDADISLTSANPHQYLQAPKGNASERRSLRDLISSKTKLLAQRRAYIHDYVSKKHYELKYSLVAEDIFDRTREKLNGRIAGLVPGSVKKFTAVYDNLKSHNDEDWSNAVHSCRRILQETADVIYPAREDKMIEVGGKARTLKLGPDNYINRLVAFVEERSTSTRFVAIVGSHLKYLGERLDAIFQAAQKGSHATISSREEADRYVIYTYLVIADILELYDPSSIKT